MRIMSPRLREAWRQKPSEPVSVEELQIEDVNVNYHSVDPAFLRNKNLPIDPKIIENKEQAYQEEIARWADLDYEEE